MQAFEQWNAPLSRKAPLEAALVLEGGAMRTMYTAGVLDIFMESGLDLGYVIGTSSGSLTGVNYSSWQPGRTAHITINYCHESNYISFLNRFRHDSVFNLDFLFAEPEGRWPEFDEQTYMDPRRRFVAVATCCETGEPVYFDKPSLEDLPICLKASCGLPILSRLIDTDKGKCLDGGMTDSIPFRKAMSDGYNKVVVVKTRHASYRKKPTPPLAASLYQRAFEEYPKFLDCLLSRPERYNEQLDHLRELERDGSLLVIEPQRPVTVSRAERNKTKLRTLYEQGRTEGTNILPRLLEYLND